MQIINSTTTYHSTLKIYFRGGHSSMVRWRQWTKERLNLTRTMRVVRRAAWALRTTAFPVFRQQGFIFVVDVGG
ncbi:hypothetical protein P8452_04349 [Trifolium repens]|nr:hypothetical protein P8452_04349 [Trifolium repens]